MMEILDYYLIIVNIVGFILFVLNMWLHSHTANGQIGGLLTVISLAGGSFGILIAILLMDRKTKKDNVMSKVFITCVFVIQVITILLIKGYHADHITFAFWTFFHQRKILTAYLGIMNAVTFAVFAMDKFNAVRDRRRIRIVTLLGLAFVGGSLGGLLAMYVFKHKTQKDYFTTGIPLIILMQIVVIFYMMNIGW
uniref:DUF1294 domain-containing protein n=1 Tax=Eubacterium plexicaudatum ASF492 TaxID=1235802 RepID=N1ZYA6_9FIRM